MGYKTLRHCVEDLLATGRCVQIHREVDARLEAAEIHRRVFRAGGPALFFTRVKGCRFPMVSNLFGTPDRTRYLFRDTLDQVRQLIALKADPAALGWQAGKYLSVARTAWHTRPRTIRDGGVTDHLTTIDQLPQQVSWPDDGGAFATLPAVYTEDVRQPGVARSNLGMYRIQLSGGEYEPNHEIGLHYQIHRGIGVHHAAAIAAGRPLQVNVLVGGPPALTLSAMMPLPEGLPELFFAGALGGRRLSLIRTAGQLPIVAEADFCISGEVDPDARKPEGPFGDHLGYYSLAHDFPVLKVRAVYHRSGAIWPFTVVGRPPQEDTMFGDLVHELTEPVIPTVIPGVRAVNAVDAAGVHPLLLAIGSERYLPYAERSRPQELLTQANAILGQGQMSLAKYLWIVAGEDDRTLNIHDVAAFLRHALARVDWQRDLHFQTCTTIDTLDYTGGKLNEGSKVVIAAVGPPRRELPTSIEGDLQLPAGLNDPRVCLPGVLAIQGPKFTPGDDGRDSAIEEFCRRQSVDGRLSRFPLVVVVDDSPFTSASLNNFLWVTFTRSNPADDVYGVDSFIDRKHWGCRGALVIDARLKPHHAPPLVEDPEVTKRIDPLFASGGILSKWSS